MLKLVTDLKAVRYNVLKIKKNKDKRIYLVVKANAYGHGAPRVASSTQDIVEGFAVANADEGAELRLAGIKKEILVLGFDIDEAERYKAYGLTPCVYRREQIDRLLALGVRAVHIAVDSGMHRRGASADRARELLRACKASGIAVKGLYTHYASVEAIDRQNIEFERIEFDGIRHAAASSAYALDKAYYDAVRIGLAAYGCIEGKGLLPALKVLSKVENVVALRRGESIGYDLAYTAREDTDIAVVFGGYADGIRRSYTGGRVKIKGRLCPIVGKVCMDCFFVDVGGLKVNVGDEVEVVGEDCTVNALAELAGSIPYEVLCSFDTRRARRVYV